MATIDPILEGVYRVASFDEKIGISFNQYLILDENPTLIHTGAAPLFDDVISAIRRVTDPGELRYVFISHFEADECGSLTRFQEIAKKLVPVCPAVTARQLTGFGLCGNALAKKPGETLELGRRRLQFVSYPSEMHLWEGLIAYQETDQILYTSDLFIRRGPNPEPIVEGTMSEFAEIPAMSIPSEEGRKSCLEAIQRLDISWMALGHGPVVKIKG